MEFSKVYELRKYTIKPEHYQTAVDVLNKHIDIRTKYSKMFGFWFANLGDKITQFVHIWEYDSLSHRSQAAAAMNSDPAWTTQVLKHISPCILEGTTTMLIQSPGTKFNIDFEKADTVGVYLYEEAKVDRLNNLPGLADSLEGGGVLVARFCGILGKANTEYRLWRFPNIDGAARGAVSKAMTSPSSSSCDSHTTMLTPASFSSLQ